MTRSVKGHHTTRRTTDKSSTLTSKIDCGKTSFTPFKKARFDTSKFYDWILRISAFELTYFAAGILHPKKRALLITPYSLVEDRNCAWGSPEGGFETRQTFGAIGYRERVTYVYYS